MIALAMFVVYVLSAPPGVILDDLDAAEFQTVGAAGGLLHQPYPLWCLVARGFAHLPLGCAAFRVTLVSGVFAAIGVGLFFVLAWMRTRHRTASLAAATGLGLSLTWWQFASVAEVYAFMTCFVVAALLCIERIRRSESHTWVVAFAFVVGVLFSQQTLNVAAIPAIVLLLVGCSDVRRQFLRRRAMAIRAAAFLVPFASYAYTVHVLRTNPPMNWIEHYGRYVAQARGSSLAASQRWLDQLWFQLWLGRLNPEWPGAIDYLRANAGWTRYLATVEFPVVGAVLGGIGLVTRMRRDRLGAMFLLVFAAPYVAVANLPFTETHAYSLPAHVVFALFIADGIAEIARRASQSERRRNRLGIALVVALVVGLPPLRYTRGSVFASVLPYRARRVHTAGRMARFVHLLPHDNLGADYAVRVDSLLQPGDLVFARWREANVLFYHQVVNAGLRGVRLSYILPTQQQMSAMVDSLRPHRVYVTPPPKGGWNEGMGIVDSLRVLRGCVLYRVDPRAWPRGRPPSRTRGTATTGPGSDAAERAPQRRGRRTPPG